VSQPSAATVVIACATVIEEMLPLMPDSMERRVLEFGLHAVPNRLHQALQAAIDETVAAHPGQALTILLGYGLCSRALEGIEARGCTLVMPRVHDCIAIFLGSHSAYQQQAGSEPGTYYLTKGWIEAGDNPFDEVDRARQRWGPERAEMIRQAMLGNYRRLALIDTGSYDLERYRATARATADRFGLRFEEIEGSPDLVRRLLEGPWDEDFVVLQPGERFTLEQFVG
jgi:hypothetical protein